MVEAENFSDHPRIRDLYFYLFGHCPLSNADMLNLKHAGSILPTTQPDLPMEVLVIEKCF